MRIRSASSPPSSKKPKLMTRYRMPMSLWSTVVNQRSAPLGRNSSTAGAGYGEATVAISGFPSGDAFEPSLEAFEVVHQRVEVRPLHRLERRHQHARLDGLRVANPFAEVVGRIGDHA